jgi:nitrous oxidase accessory protein NosD
MASRKKDITVVKVFLLIAILAMVLAGTVNAATIEVKQLGCGTQTNCYTNISDAISYAQPGDTIKVYPGSYTEAVVIDINLTLIGSGPQFTKINSTSDGITVNSFVNATIIGFSVKSSNYGIYAMTNSETNIRNNVIESNASVGIYIHWGVSTITNNVIAYNASHGIRSDSNDNYTSITVTNNIIFSNGMFGLSLTSDRENISYNNLFANISGNYNGCSAGTGDISINPCFIDPLSGNFVLSRSTPPCISTCINGGTPGSADADPDGTRNDMGAYGGPDSTPFWPYPQGAPIITNLTVTPTSVQKGGTITIDATGEVHY